MFLLSVTYVYADPTSHSTVLVDTNGSSIVMEIHFPLDQLQLAIPDLKLDNSSDHMLDKSSELNLDKDSGLKLNSRASLNGESIMQLYSYLHQHVAITTDNNDPYTLDVDSIDIDHSGDLPQLQANLTFTLPDSTEPDITESGETKPNSFNLHFSAILHQQMAHEAYVQVRAPWQDDALPDSPYRLNILHYGHESIRIDGTETSLWNTLRQLQMSKYGVWIDGTLLTILWLCLIYYLVRSRRVTRPTEKRLSGKKLCPRQQEKVEI
ncbi:hypothetical protein BTA51_20080 [Hahella sp. CCB-MM4]|nr:hypothetical protein BTA51_20080 [Hahella sp. CCB-MM4]